MTSKPTNPTPKFQLGEKVILIEKNHEKKYFEVSTETVAEITLRKDNIQYWFDAKDYEADEDCLFTLPEALKFLEEKLKVKKEVTNAK